MGSSHLSFTFCLKFSIMASNSWRCDSQSSLSSSPSHQHHHQSRHNFLVPLAQYHSHLSISVEIRSTSVIPLISLPFSYKARIDNEPAHLQVLVYYLLSNWSLGSTNMSLQLEGTRSTYNLHLQVVFENPNPSWGLVCVTIVRPGPWLLWSEPLGPRHGHRGYITTWCIDKQSKTKLQANHICHDLNYNLRAGFNSFLFHWPFSIVGTVAVYTGCPNALLLLMVVS